MPEGGWRDHMIWIFLAALAPLAFSLGFPDRPKDSNLEHRVEQPESDEETELEEGEELPDPMPEVQLAEAHLPYDTQLHWGYGLIAGAVFLGVLSIMSVGSLLALGIAIGSFVWLAWLMWSQRELETA